MMWFRLYSEFATDPVVQSLSFDDQRHFVMILCLKCSGVLDKEFGHPQVRNDVLRKTLGLDGIAFQEARTRLCAARLIDGEWQPTNWKKRQFISDQIDPTAAERMRRYRNKHRNDTVTLRPSESDTDTESEAEETKRGSVRGKRAVRAPAARLPEGFELTPERRAIAAAERIDPEREFAKFCDHWRSQPGVKGRKLDWDATWRNWCRSDIAARSAKARTTPGQQTLTWRPPPDEDDAQERF